jgi:hypothetical protein
MACKPERAQPGIDQSIDPSSVEDAPQQAPLRLATGLGTVGAATVLAASGAARFGGAATVLAASGAAGFGGAAAFSAAAGADSTPACAENPGNAAGCEAAALSNAPLFDGSACVDTRGGKNSVAACHHGSASGAFRAPLTWMVQLQRTQETECRAWNAAALQSH